MAEFRQSGVLDAMRCLDGRLPIALDGAEYHCSDKIHCPNCSHRKRSKGKLEYFHSMLDAAVVAPGHNRAVPLEPEFILPQSLPPDLVRGTGTRSRTASAVPSAVG